MKKSLLLVASAGFGLLLIAAVMFRERPPALEEIPPAKTITPTIDGGSVEVSQDAKEIFRRAFWRQPTDEDSILHAERREWVDAEKAVQHWQWFLEVEPSAALIRDLRDVNRFSLAEVTSRQLPTRTNDAAPAWYPTDAQLADFEILQNPSGGLTILRHRQKNLIFATDQGQGFAAPARPLRQP